MVNRHTLTLTRLLLSLKRDTGRRIRDHYDVDRLSKDLYDAARLADSVVADEWDTASRLNRALVEWVTNLIQGGYRSLDRATLSLRVQKAALRDARIRIANGHVDPHDEELVLFGYGRSYIVDPALVVLTDERLCAFYEPHRFDGFGIACAPRWVYKIIEEELGQTPASKTRKLHTVAVPVPTEQERELFVRLIQDMPVEDAYEVTSTLTHI
jgi:hypothetical protein